MRAERAGSSERVRPFLIAATLPLAEQRLDHRTQTQTLKATAEQRHERGWWGQQDQWAWHLELYLRSRRFCDAARRTGVSDVTSLVLSVFPAWPWNSPSTWTMGAPPRSS